MKFRHRIQKSDAAPAAVADNESSTTRLTAIEVDEVSIVDRAANQRKYLVVKQKGKKEVEKALPPPTTANPAPPPAPAPAAAPAAQAPVALKISPEMKAKVLGALQAAQQKIGILMQALQGAVDTPGAPPPQELMDALTQLAQLLGTSAAPAAPAPAPGAAPPAPPPPGTQKDATEKAGRKISAKRLETLTSARELLNGLIADVSGGEEEEEAEEEKTEAAPAKKAEQAAPASASPELQAIQNSLTAMTETIGSVAKVLEGQNKRIETLAKSRGASRQVDPDSKPVEKAASEPLWEMDMARPMRTVQ